MANYILNNHLGLLVGCVFGEKKEVLLSPNYSPLGEEYWKIHDTSLEVLEIILGRYKSKEAPEIKPSGFVVDTLEAALWAFYKTDNFRDGCLLAVNLGGDADTIAAVFGQIAGAFYGAKGIPKEWRDRVFYGSLIEVLSGEIACLSDRTKDVKLPDDSKYEKVDFSIHVQNLSAKYVQVKLKGFSFLEEKSRELVRRLKPCPKQFKELSEVDRIMKEIELEYFKIDGVCPELFKDFKTMWLCEKEKLQLRLERKLK